MTYKDLFSDIASGICTIQKIQSNGYDLSKIKIYTPRTAIPQIINEIIRDSKFEKDYLWQYEKDFVRSDV